MSGLDLRHGKGYAEYTALLHETIAWLAKKYGVHPGALCMTSGATGAIDAALSCFSSKDAIVVMPLEYFDVQRMAAARGLKLVRQPMRGSGVAYDPDAFISWIRAKKPAGCYLSVPNNPTGVSWTRAQLVELLRAMQGGTVIIDQALYAARPIPLRWFAKHAQGTRVMVIRSFAKSHGLVKERIGLLYCVDPLRMPHAYAHAPAATSLLKLRSHWDSPHTREHALRLEQHGRLLQKWAQPYPDVTVTPSRSNFACCMMPRQDLEGVVQRLADEGIRVMTSQALGSEGSFFRVDLSVSGRALQRLMRTVDAWLTRDPQVVLSRRS